LSHSRRHFSSCKYCPYCKRKASEHQHTFIGVLANGLYDFAKKSFARTPVELKSLGWSRTRWQNFTKLKYWGLIEQPEPKSGKWRLTEKGLEFVTGEIRIPKFVWTWDDEVVEVAEEEILLADVWSEMPGYLSRFEFAAVERPHFETGQKELFFGVDLANGEGDKSAIVKSKVNDDGSIEVVSVEVKKQKGKTSGLK